MIKVDIAHSTGLLLTAAIIVAGVPAVAAEPTLKEIMQGLRDDLVEISDGLLADDLERVSNVLRAAEQ